ncbi:MAG: hypothetical protein ABIV04_00195 [Massilia sp.]
MVNQIAMAPLGPLPKSPAKTSKKFKNSDRTALGNHPNIQSSGMATGKFTKT